MIDIFEVLSWLNELDNCSQLTEEAKRLIKLAGMMSRSDGSVRRILERLRNAGYSSSNPYEKGEVLLHYAAIEYWRGWLPEAICAAREAVVSYDNDDHRRAVALWMLGMPQWEMLQNHEAYRNWAEAKELFKRCQILFQHFPHEKSRYKIRIRQMDVELVGRPEEISTWLNYFERSNLRPRTQQVVKCAQEKIRQQAYTNIYAVMQDLQEANRWCEEIYERAEIYLEFGLAMYQMGNKHYAIELIRKSVESFSPGIGAYHKQVVARCMLGALEWMNKSSHSQAFADWNRSIEEFEHLKLWSSRDDNQTKREWYAEHRAILHSALLERLAGPRTKPTQNPRPPGSSYRDPDIPEANGPKPSPSGSTNKKTDLYQDLLIKVRWDRAVADRLIELERKKAPTADRNELIKRAIEHWLRDNK